MTRDPRIKYHLQNWGFQTFMSVSLNDEIWIFVVIRNVENGYGLIFAKRLPNRQIFVD